MMLLIDAEKEPHLNVEEICFCASIDEDMLNDIVGYSIVTPISGQYPREWLFCVSEVEIVKRAVRIYRDLNVDWMGIALILNLLEESHKLEVQNASLKI